MKICDEFNSQKDFRFKGQSETSDVYCFQYDGNNYYQLTHKSRRQYDWFVPQKGKGLTQAGLARINRSIENLQKI